MRVRDLLNKWPLMAMGAVAVAMLPVAPAAAAGYKTLASVRTNCNYHDAYHGQAGGGVLMAWASDACNDNDVTAAGWAEVDFPHGTLRGYVTVNGGLTGWGTGDSASYTTQLFDTMWIEGPGSEATVTALLGYHGTFTGPASYQLMTTSLRLNGQTWSAECQAGTCSGQLVGTLTVPVGRSFELQAIQGAAVSTDSAQVVGDFSHTTTLSITLPAGYTLHDADGAVVFTSSVPEPASAALMALGAAALLGWRRRQAGRDA